MVTTLRRNLLVLTLLLAGLWPASSHAGDSIFDPGAPTGANVFVGSVTFKANTANSVLILNGSQVLTSLVPTNGQLVIGSTGATPTLGTPTSALSTITWTGGAGTLAADVGPKLILPVQTISVADNGIPASPAAFTLTPTKAYVEITCNDPDGCNATFDKSQATQGYVAKLINISANTVNYAKTAGLSQLAAAFAAGQWSTLTVVYAADRWVEYARSSN
jgi:hypothetical protein